MYPSFNAIKVEPNNFTRNDILRRYPVFPMLKLIFLLFFPCFFSFWFCTWTVSVPCLCTFLTNKSINSCWSSLLNLSFLVLFVIICHWYRYTWTWDEVGQQTLSLTLPKWLLTEVTNHSRLQKWNLVKSSNHSKPQKWTLAKRSDHSRQQKGILRREQITQGHKRKSCEELQSLNATVNASHESALTI